MKMFYARLTMAMLFAMALYFMTPPTPSSATVDSGQVPLLDDGSTIRVPVKMFGGTLYFIVDTGSALSLLDSDYLDKLGPSIRNLSAGTGISSGNAISVYACPELYVGSVHGRLEEIGCESLKTFQYITGEKCDGVLGMDFLKAYAVTIDFDSHTLSLSDRVTDAGKNHAQSVPFFDIAKNIVGVQTKLNSVHAANLIVDTGDSRSISLNRVDWEDAFQKDSGTKIHNVMAVALNSKPTQVSTARLNQLEVGSSKYTNLLCVLIPNPKQPSGLGLRFLRQHFVILDFPDHVLYLRHREHYDAPDDPDMSGLHLLRRDGTTTVYAVDEQSPAALAGVKAGDIIRTVDGQDIAQMAMEELRHRLRSADGASVRGTVERDGEIQDFKMLLKKPL